MSIVSANRSFDIYLTATPPQHIRFRMLNAEPNYKIRLSLHYFTSNRIDVYRNSTFVDPTNAVYVNGKMTLKDTSDNLTAYMPHYTNVSGTNLAVRADSKVYFTIGGENFFKRKKKLIFY